MRVKEVARRSASGLDPQVWRQVERLVSPIVGPVRRLMFLSYDESRPALFTVIPELADVHRRAGLRAKPEYHVGGFGFVLEEALLRALGEAVERTAHVAFHVRYGRMLRRGSRRSLASEGLRLLPLADLGRFSPEQKNSRAFPFATASEESALTWAPTIDLRDREETWVPAQVLTEPQQERTRLFVRRLQQRF